MARRFPPVCQSLHQWALLRGHPPAQFVCWGASTSTFTLVHCPSGMTCQSSDPHVFRVRQPFLVAELVYRSQTLPFLPHFPHVLAWAVCLWKVYSISLPEGRVVLFHLSLFSSLCKPARRAKCGRLQDSPSFTVSTQCIYSKSSP